MLIAVDLLMKATKAGADMGHAYALIVAVTPLQQNTRAGISHLGNVYCSYQQYCDDLGVGESLPQLLIAQPARHTQEVICTQSLCS